MVVVVPGTSISVNTEQFLNASLPILVRLFPKDAYVSFWQLVNALSPIETVVFGSRIAVRAAQLKNAALPIFFRLSPNDIEVILDALSKALYPISVKEDGSETLTRDVQSLNAPIPITCCPLKLMADSFWQFLNAFFPISLTDEGKVTDVRFVLSLNAPSAIRTTEYVSVSISTEDAIVIASGVLIGCCLASHVFSPIGM